MPVHPYRMPTSDSNVYTLYKKRGSIIYNFKSNSVMKKKWNEIKFTEAWITYLEYLSEDHLLHLNKEQEIESLETLKKISEKDVDKAIEIIEYMVLVGSTTIFLPTNEQLSGDEPYPITAAKLRQ